MVAELRREPLIERHDHVGLGGRVAELRPIGQFVVTHVNLTEPCPQGLKARHGIAMDGRRVAEVTAPKLIGLILQVRSDQPDLPPGLTVMTSPAVASTTPRALSERCAP